MAVPELDMDRIYFFFFFFFLFSLFLWYFKSLWFSLQFLSVIQFFLSLICLIVSALICFKSNLWNLFAGFQISLSYNCISFYFRVIAVFLFFFNAVKEEN